MGGITPTISLKGISKTFASTTVLSDFDLDLLPGEIHGLVGQNGSGKSTFVKILSGYHTPDPGGQLLIREKEVPLPVAPGTPRRHGISFVHQDLALIDDLSVADNVWIGKYPRARGRRIDRRRLERRTRDALRSFRLDIDPDSQVAHLTAGQRAVLAIIRAVIDVESHSDAAIILDEPTARLDHEESHRLFDAMQAAAQRGASILFISHRLDEVLSVTNRITVLRGGRKIGTVATAVCSEEELIEMIVGSRLTSLYPDTTKSSATPLLQVRELFGPTVRGLNFEVHAGEVLGLTGLPGAGFDEVPYLMIGAVDQARGQLVLRSQVLEVAEASIRERLRSGLAFVPGDRTRQGAAATLAVGENVTLPRISDFVRKMLLDVRAERRDVLESLRSFDVRPPRPDATFGTLSGGNQQKAVLAKWLRTDPSVLIMHEPTWGVDIGARKQIFEMISGLAAAGRGVVLASIEYEDLAHLAHRVLVLRRGTISSELVGSELVKERILEECYRS